MIQYLLPLVALLLLPLVLACMVRWRWGFLGLLLFLPFAGAVTLALYPSDLPKLLKDLVFALPCIAMFFLAGGDGIGRARVPSWLTLLVGLYAFVVLAQSGNPNLHSWPVAVIGIKVSLLYIPLLYVAAAYCETAEEMMLLMRRLLLVGLVSCLFGILCFFLSVAFGYNWVMETIYGAAARSATQGFTGFDYGVELYRFNSTFTFSAQYGQFTLAMLIPAYAVAFSDSRARWRLLGKIAFCVVVVACLLSGSRSLFVFVPLLLLLTLLIDARLTKLFAGVLLAPVFGLVVLELLGFDVALLFSGVSNLAASYSQNVAVGGLLDTLTEHPFGTGTGMGSIAARHVLPETVELHTVENYYAKIVLELGVLGLLAIFLLFGGMIVAGLRARQQTAGTPMQAVASALLGYLVTIAVTSGKGWALDLDPVNIYFWVFAGLLFKLPHLALGDALTPQEAPQHPFLASLRRPPVLLGGQSAAPPDPLRRSPAGR